MPIDTRLDGRPEEVRATATWLRDQLAFEVKASASTMSSARNDAGSGWQGAAGTAFQGRMSGHTTTADTLHTDIATTVGELNDYANRLATAQHHMANAREIALNGGLTIEGLTINEPGSTPHAPAPGATPEMLTAHADAVTAYQRQADAYVLAEGEAQKADAMMRTKSNVWGNIYDDVRTKWPLIIADGVNGVYGGLLSTHIGILRKHATDTFDQVKKIEANYLKSQGGSAHSRSLVKLMSEMTLDGHAVERQAVSVGKRFGSKVPIIGAAITVAGIGYDIHNGKPAVKAVASGAGGMLASIGGGMAAGAALGAMGANPLTVVVGAAIGGVAAGLLASGAIDAAYDRLPKGVLDAFDAGQTAVGQAFSEVGDDAKELWDKIF